MEKILVSKGPCTKFPRALVGSGWSYVHALQRLSWGNLDGMSSRDFNINALTKDKKKKTLMLKSPCNIIKYNTHRKFTIDITKIPAVSALKLHRGHPVMCHAH